MNKNIPAVNFTDFCKTASPAQIYQALKFYTKPFDEKLIGEYFLGWSFPESDHKGSQVWSFELADKMQYATFVFKRAQSEYQIIKDYPIDLVFPFTMGDFISDFLRYQPDFEKHFSEKSVLTLTEKAYDEIYAHKTVIKVPSIINRGRSYQIEVPIDDDHYIKITKHSESDFIEVNGQGGAIVIHPSVSNEIKISLKD